MLATKIMFYNEGVAVKTLDDGRDVCEAPHGVTAGLEKCVSKVVQPPSARDTLHAWSDLLKAKFEADNAHMSPAARAQPDLAPLVAAIAGLSTDDGRHQERRGALWPAQDRRDGNRGAAARRAARFRRRAGRCRDALVVARGRL
jgi:hypothetical protein